MKEIGSSKIVVLKSKFFSYLFEIHSTLDIDKLLQLMKFEYPKSTHICYAACVSGNEIFKNGHEVGNPGKILLELLKRKNLFGHALIVVRIYGGVNLGHARVGRAFREAGKSAFEFV